MRALPTRRPLLRVAALALGLAATALPSQDPVGAPDDAPHPVLARSPAEWPAAEPGRWAGWRPEVPPDAALRPLLAEVARTYGGGDLPAALDALFGLLEDAPDYPPALHQAGVIYFRLQRYGDSARAFERYLATVPERVADTRALGHCYYSLGEYDRALDHYERVLAAAPESAEALRGYALCHVRLGLAVRALELLGRVVELAPDHGDAHAWIAQVLFDAERSEEALVAADRARELSPYDSRPWYLASQILFDLGRDEEGEAARSRFELLNRVAQEVRALEARLLLDPRLGEAYSRLVALHRQTGNVPAARSALARWNRVDPGDVALRILVLDFLWELGDRPGAAQAAAALEEAGARDARAWDRLADYYAGLGDRAREGQAEQRAARLRAGDGAAGGGGE